MVWQPGDGTTESPAELNKGLVRALIDEVSDAGNIDLIDDLCTYDVVNHAGRLGLQQGRQALRDALTWVQQSMDDRRWSEQHYVAEDDLVIVYGVREGYWHAANFRGIETPDPGHVSVELAHMFRIRDGRIVEHWAVRDDLGVMQQLGARMGPSSRASRDSATTLSAQSDRHVRGIPHVTEAPGSRPPIWTGHVTLPSSDPTIAARFYEQLGMRTVQTGEHVAVLEMRGGTHLVIRHDPEHVAPGLVQWDLMVDDLDGIHEKWQSRGLAVTPIAAGSPHRAFEVTDPDGHVLAVRDSHVVGSV